MRKFTRSAILALVLVSTGASALPRYKDRFVHAKSGYVVVVERQEIDSPMVLTGRHPATGSSFRLQVSRQGKVTGIRDGRPVDFALGDKPGEAPLVTAAVEASGGTR